MTLGRRLLARAALPLLALLLAARCTAATAAPASHCGKGEQTLFSCQLKRSAKVVSLCASELLREDAGYIQYRFGRPGSIELTFPATRSATQQQFRRAHYMRFQVDRTSVSFRVGKFTYALYHNYEGEEEPPVDEAGVRVNGNELACAKPFVNRLHVLEGIVPCDPDSGLGECR